MSNLVQVPVWQKIRNGYKRPYTGLNVKLVDVHGVLSDQTLTDSDTIGLYSKDGVPVSAWYLKIDYGSGYVNPDNSTYPVIINVGEALLVE